MKNQSITSRSKYLSFLLAVAIGAALALANHPRPPAADSVTIQAFWQLFS